MTACFVPDCNHRPGVNKCSFHTFPKTTSVRRRWIQNIRRGDRRPNQNSRVCSCHFTKGLQKGPIWFPSRVKGIPPVEEDMVEEEEEEEEEEEDRPRVASQTQTFYSPRVEHQAASGGVDRPASAAQQQQQDQRMVIVHQDQGPATGQLQVIPQGVTVIPSPGQQIMEVTLPDGQTQSCLFSPTAIPASSTATTIDDAGRPHSAARTPLQGDPDPTVDDAGRNWTLTPIEKDPDPTDPLQCVQCCITFSDAKGKMRHIRKSHREEYIQQIEQADTIFSCYVCERSFQSSSALCAHQYTHSSEDKRYKCDGCNEVFYFFSELTTHRRRACHSREEKLHKCDSCNEGFYSLAELTTHRRQVCPSIKRRPKKTPPSALPQGQSEPSALPHGQEPSALPEGQSAPTDSVLT